MDQNTANAMALNMLSPEARAAFSGAYPKMTLRAARERLENATSQAEQKALKEWVRQYETTAQTRP